MARSASTQAAGATPLMTSQEVADYLRVPLQTLAAWRVKGVGPKASRVGKHLRYRLADVDMWLEANAD